MTEENRRAIAFEGSRRIAEGSVLTVAAAVKDVVDRGETAPVLVFDAETSVPIELDLRGSLDDVLARLQPIDAPDVKRGPGRPKLGVVSREVTLLPRHWDWLATQPGGASVSIRRLVDDARRTSESTDRVRVQREAAYRFMSAIAGNAPDFEEATRAFFAGDGARFTELIAAWPPDVRAHALTLADATFEVAP